jgi:hypothetical protein
LEQIKHTEVAEVRKKIFEEQNFLCLITKKPTQRPVLDHQHKKGLGGSGLCRGVIDANINVFLGKIENNCKRYGIQIDDLPDVLRSIAEYLERPHLPILHPSEREKKKMVMKSSYNKLLSAIKKSGNERDLKRLPKYTGNMSKILSELAERYQIEMIMK